MSDFNIFKEFHELSFGNTIKTQFEKVNEEYIELLIELHNNDYKTSEEAIQEAFDLIQATVNLLPLLSANVGDYVEHNAKKRGYLRDNKYPKETVVYEDRKKMLDLLRKTSFRIQEQIEKLETEEGNDAYPHIHE